MYGLESKGQTLNFLAADKQRKTFRCITPVKQLFTAMQDPD